MTKPKVYLNSKLAKILLCLSSCHTIMLFGAVFSKRSKLDEIDINHEFIHCLQYKDHFVIGWILSIIALAVLSITIGIGWYLLLLLLIPALLFYIVYCLEYLFDLVFQILHCIKHPSEFKVLFHSVYRYCLAFEQESYANQYNLKYLDSRIPIISTYRYFGKLTYCKKSQL